VKNRGFTLIELLIVIVLMGIVYSLYFFTKQESKNTVTFTLKNMKEYLRNASVSYGDKLKLIYYFDNKVVYLTDSKNNLLESIDFDQELSEYILKKDEQIDLKHYKPVEIGENYFEPTFIYERLGKDLFSDLILNNKKNEWLYFDTYFNDSFIKFLDENRLINFIKKKDYLPMYAGKVE